jgi:hypothetical protein
MRTLTAAAIAALLFVAPAAAQVRSDLRNNVGAATEAAPPSAEVSAPNATSHILDGTWARTGAPTPGTLIMQTGEDGTLTGTYGGKPCQGAYVENRFTLYCQYSGSNSYLITGRATRIEPEVSANLRARIVAQPARIDGYLAYLTTGLTPDGRSREFFRAARP